MQNTWFGQPDQHKHQETCRVKATQLDKSGSIKTYSDLQSQSGYFAVIFSMCISMKEFQGNFLIFPHRPNCFYLHKWSIYFKVLQSHAAAFDKNQGVGGNYGKRKTPCWSKNLISIETSFNVFTEWTERNSVKPQVGPLVAAHNEGAKQLKSRVDKMILDHSAKFGNNWSVVYICCCRLPPQKKRTVWSIVWNLTIYMCVCAYSCKNSLWQ